MENFKSFEVGKKFLQKLYMAGTMTLLASNLSGCGEKPIQKCDCPNGSVSADVLPGYPGVIGGTTCVDTVGDPYAIARFHDQSL